MAYTTATLTGTYLQTDGTPAEGNVEIIPNSRQLVDAAGDVILSGRVKVALDEAGSFSVVLPATDDASLEPATGRQYTVVAKLRHAHLAAVTGVELAGGTTVDVADVASAPETDPEVTNAATTAQLAALETTVAGKADAADVTTLDGRVDTVETGLGDKQDAATLDADVTSLLNDPASDTAETLSATVDAAVDTRKALTLLPDPLYQYAARNVVMASPPTVTEGASATINGQVINPLTDTRLRNLHGVTVGSADGTAAQARNPRKTDGTFSNTTGNYWYSVEFMVDCSAIEFRILGNTNNYLLVVDGERHTATNGTLAGGGASRYLKFDFGGRKAGGGARRVQFTCTAAQFKEIRLGATDTLYPVPVPAPTMAVLGDSYGTGYAARAMVSVYDGYAQQLGRLLGVVPVTQNSASATGFVDTDGATAGDYASRVADVVALDPDIVLVQGSINDSAASDVALQAAAEDVFSTLTAGLPDAVRVATGILDARASGVRPANVDAQNAIIQAAAEANGFTFVSTGTFAEWVSGTGYLTAPTGVGNSDVYTYSDQVHYTTGGGLYLANRLAQQIRAAAPALR